MIENTRVLLTCAFAAVVFGAGCASDSRTLTGPTLSDEAPHLDLSGLGAGGQPEISRFEEEISLAASCPTFAVTIEGQVSGVVQIFESHLVIHLGSRVTLTNVASGFSIRDYGAFTQVVHFNQPGTVENVTFVGGVYRITIPGTGIAVQDTGIITYDPITGQMLFEAGPHDAFYSGFAYCALLAGGAA